MKTILYFALLSVTARASTVYIDSNAWTSNNSGDPTMDVRQNPEWARALPGSEWISYGQTGYSREPGYFSPPDGTLVTFTIEFTLSGLIDGGSLTVLADDSTSVILNGHTLISPDTIPGRRCSSKAVGCLDSTAGRFTFRELEPYLVDGVNTLSFGVVQVGGSSFGLDFAGKIETNGDPPETPEPGTFQAMGGALLALAGWRGARNRRRGVIW